MVSQVCRSQKQCHLAEGTLNSAAAVSIGTLAPAAFCGIPRHRLDCQIKTHIIYHL